MNVLYPLMIAASINGLLIFGILIVVLFNINRITDRIAYNKYLYTKSLADYITEIDTIIDSEFNFVVVMSHIGKNINMITDFKELVQEIVGNIRKNISGDYIENFTKSTHLSKNYLYTYIIRRTELRIMDYMKDNNPLNNNKE